MVACGIADNGGVRCHSRHFLALLAFRCMDSFWSRPDNSKGLTSRSHFARLRNVFEAHQMNRYDREAIEPNATFFKALGHPTRLWIVEQLADGEHCVCEFVEAVGNEFPTISRHLSVLKDAGVVIDERRGKSIYYRLSCPCVATMLECLKTRKR